MDPSRAHSRLSRRKPKLNLALPSCKSATTAHVLEYRVGRILVRLRNDRLLNFKDVTFSGPLFGQNRFAIAWLMTTTGGPLSSHSVNVRRRRIGILKVWLVGTGLGH